VIAVTVILATLAFAGVYVGQQLPIPARLYQFRSYAELVRFIQTHQPSPHFTGWITAETALLNGGGQRTDVSGTSGYSTTNVQVKGVDEPDCIKTDGSCVYAIRNEDVLAIRAYPPEQAAIVGMLQPAGSPDELFLYNCTRLVVISHLYSATAYDGYCETGTAIEVFDVSQPEHPMRIQKVTLIGGHLGARLIGKYLYLVAKSGVSSSGSQVDLPSLEVGGVTWVIPATTIYYDPTAYDYSFCYTLVLGLDIADQEATPVIQTFLGPSGGTTLYASLANLYIAVSEYSQERANRVTAIHRFSLAEGIINYAGSGEVAGYLINQFALDEHNGYLRVATTTWTPPTITTTAVATWSSPWGTLVNNVYVLDMDLKVIGSLEGLAPGEWIYSVRFLGDTGYLVTFFKIDPLFVIDLSCPSSPALLGQMEMTGYSDYLHPLGNYQLLGIGKDTAPGGETWAWYAGLKLSLFNTTNPGEPTERTRLIIGVRGTESEALHDHKAVLVDPDRQLLVIPVLLAEYDENETNPAPPICGRYVTQGAFVFHLDYATANLTLRGVVSHLVEGLDLHFQRLEAQPFFVTRILYIGDVLYTLSQYKLAFNDLTTLAPIGELILSPGFAPA